MPCFRCGLLTIPYSYLKWRVLSLINANQVLTHPMVRFNPAHNRERERQTDYVYVKEAKAKEMHLALRAEGSESCSPFLSCVGLMFSQQCVLKIVGQNKLCMHSEQRTQTYIGSCAAFIWRHFYDWFMHKSLYRLQYHETQRNAEIQIIIHMISSKTHLTSLYCYCLNRIISIITWSKVSAFK